MPLRLGFDGIASVHPGAKTTFDGSDALKTIVDEDLRRTGARLFIRSGAVGDDPLAGVELIRPGAKLFQRNGKSTRDVAGCIRISAAHIDKYCGTRTKGGYGFSEADAGNIEVGILGWDGDRGRQQGRAAEDRQQKYGKSKQNSGLRNNLLHVSRSYGGIAVDAAADDGEAILPEF